MLGVSLRCSATPFAALSYHSVGPGRPERDITVSFHAVLKCTLTPINGGKREFHCLGNFPLEVYHPRRVRNHSILLSQSFERYLLIKAMSLHRNPAKHANMRVQYCATCSYSYLGARCMFTYGLSLYSTANNNNETTLYFVVILKYSS